MRMRAVLLASLLVGVCGTSVFFPLVQADSPAVKPGIDASREQPDAEEKEERHKPLPRYFGQLGISDKQRIDLYAVQDVYESRIKKLQAELETLVSERNSKLENLLTSGQKQRLQELRENAQRAARQKKSVEGKK